MTSHPEGPRPALDPFTPPLADLGLGAPPLAADHPAWSAPATSGIERLCIACARLYPFEGECPEHPFEPLLDPHAPSTLDLMDADDGERQQRQVGFWMALGAVLGLALGGVTAGLLVASWLERGGTLHVGVPLSLLSVGGTLGAGWGLEHAKNVFRPRFAERLAAAGRPPRT